MLDAYIIDRIRRERQREERDGAFIPLHIEVPRPPERPPEKKEEDDIDKDRGSINIDFQLL